MGWHYSKQSCQQFKSFDVFVYLAFLIQPVYTSSQSSQSISLNNLGCPLSIVNVHRASPNVCILSSYLSPPTRLPPIEDSQTLARAIVSLYYLITQPI